MKLGKLVFLLQNIRSACGGDVRLFGWFVSVTDRGLSHKVKHGIRWLAKEVLKMGSEPVREKDLQYIPIRLFKMLVVF